MLYIRTILCICNGCNIAMHIQKKYNIHMFRLLKPLIKRSRLSFQNGAQKCRYGTLMRLTWHLLCPHNQYVSDIYIYIFAISTP